VSRIGAQTSHTGLDHGRQITLRRGVYRSSSGSGPGPTGANYVQQITGRDWSKSACVFCPYSVASADGRHSTLERFRREPNAGADALFMEHVSLAMNERQALMGRDRLIDEVTRAGLTEVLEMFHQRLDAAKHAIYEVRRLARPRATGAPMIARSARLVCSGGRDAMLTALRSMPGRPTTGSDGITRTVLRRCTKTPPWTEQFFVADPAFVEQKARLGFEAWWSPDLSQPVVQEDPNELIGVSQCANSTRAHRACRTPAAA